MYGHHSPILIIRHSKYYSLPAARRESYTLQRIENTGLPRGHFIRHYKKRPHPFQA